MRRIYILLLLGCLLSCNRKLQTQTTVIEIDSLHMTPETSAKLAKLGVTLTPISETKALLTQPAAKTGNIKLKNVGNTEVKQKDVGNMDIGKKAGQQQDVGNVKIKDIGNTENRSYWWVWLIVGLLFVLLAVLGYYWRKAKQLPLPF